MRKMSYIGFTLSVHLLNYCKIEIFFTSTYGKSLTHGTNSIYQPATNLLEALQAKFKIRMYWSTNNFKISHQTQIALACIWKNKLIPRSKVHHSDNFFPTDYEYVNYFFQARPYVPKFYVKGLKIGLSICFEIVLILKITKNFNAMHA